MSRRDSICFAAGALLATVLLVTAHAWLGGAPTSMQDAQNVVQSIAQPSMGHDTQMSQGTDKAGSLDDVTRKLEMRLAAKGGSDEDWRLLAQSYQYMGRTEEARAAQAHKISLNSSAAASADAAANAPRPASAQELAAVADAFDAPAAQRLH
jgi:hypothetical protein